MKRHVRVKFSGATVLVVGVGGIGSAFIRHAKYFGMHVIAVRENASKGKAKLTR